MFDLIINNADCKVPITNLEGGSTFIWKDNLYVVKNFSLDSCHGIFIGNTRRNIKLPNDTPVQPVKVTKIECVIQTDV